MLPVETNILIFEVKGAYSAVSFSDHMRMHDILCLAISATQVRIVTHLDITPAMIEHFIQVLEEM